MKGFGEFKPHHLPMEGSHAKGNGGTGRIFLLPGAEGRARRIGERLEDLEVLDSPRGHNVFLGSVTRNGVTVEVGAVSTGMGCPSLDIIVTELIGLGARRFIRVGTAGSLQPRVVKAGSLVVATGGVRDETISDAYATTGYPAMAHYDMVKSLCGAAKKRGLADEVFVGIVHSKDALYCREFGYGPLGDRSREYMQALKELPVLASEMESAHLFVLSDAYSEGIVPLSKSLGGASVVKSGALLAIIGDERPFAPKELVKKAEEEVIETSLDGCAELLRREHALQGVEAPSPNAE